jgi:uncharacterized membrane protein (UPF0182 family)
MPPRQPRRRRERRGGRLPSGRGRVALIVVVVALVVLAMSLRGIAGFYTDYLWFDSLGLASIWRGVLGAKTALALIFIGFFFILLWTNLFIADRIAPTFRLPASGPEDDLVERYHEIVGTRAGMLRTGVAFLLALIVGSGVSAKWKDWILFTNRVDFGRKDATFHTDIGFYVFQLPFLRFVLGWLFSALVVVLIATIVAHYLNGGIRIQVPGQRVSPQVKAHLSVLLGVLALVRAGQYWLDRYQLVFSTRGTVDGATYTDVNVQVKSLYLLMIISITAFVLFLVNIRRRGWVLPGIAVGLWLFVIVLAGEAVPALVQRFRVKPDEPSKEAVYISHNIAATRYAMGLQGVHAKQFDIDGKLDAATLADNSDIIQNVRLWDPAVVQAAFDRTQGSGLRDFYAIPDVDVDRYTLNRPNGSDTDVTQVNVAARQLARDGIPQKSWVSEHLTYTHGYGAVVSPANEVSPFGQPVFTAQDVPLRPNSTPKITEPRIYIGEDQTGYVIVNSGVKEVDYTDDAGNNVQRNYSGKDGVKLDSFIRRAAFALRFGDINPLISSNVKSGSKLLLQRNVRDRVEAAAPFLSFDADPYPVVENGRILWVIDGYTTTSNYPNAQRADNTDVSDTSGLADNFNYVRNSVKATVDAYDGTITMYVVDDSDPIIRAYEKAFPELFTPGSQVPADLRSHFRYPEDLFRVQTQMWGRYHMTDPQAFYNRADQWDVAPDPEIPGAEVQGPTTTIAGQVVRQSPRVDPYYLLTRLPDEKQDAFTLFRSFVARSEGNRTRALTAFMAVKSDPGNYGEIESFAIPPSRAPLGPQDVVQAIKADKDVSSEITLLCQQASRCESTNLIILPVDKSLLYIRPLYVAAESENSAPRLEKVIVAFQPRGTGALQVQIADSLQDALDALFPANGTGPIPPPSNNNGNGNGNGNGVAPSEQEQQLIDEIDAAYKAADAAYAKGDLAEGGKQLDIARSRYEDLRELLDARAAGGSDSGGSKETGSTTTTSTTQPTTSTTSTPASTTTEGGA